VRAALVSRLAAAALVGLTVPVGLMLSSCSTGVAQLSVTITPDFTGAYTPGTTDGDFALTVENLGPGNASGVVVHANMPPSFQFATTNSIDTTGAARTSPVDAQAGVSNPEWGVWSLSSPTKPNGTTVYASVTIDFGVNITGAPNTYTLAAQVVDDSLSNAVVSHPIQVEVNEAPRLGVTASVGPTSVHPGGEVTYRVTVTNTGTGIAPDVDVLVTLPPALQFQASIIPFVGNASVEQPIYPVKGAYLVFYGGFELPSQTTLGPGKVTIEFIAQCIANPGRGVFPAQIQVTDSLGDQVHAANVAPVNVFSG